MERKEATGVIAVLSGSMYVQMNQAANWEGMQQVPGKNEQKYVIRNPQIHVTFYTQLFKATNNSQIAGTNKKRTLFAFSGNHFSNTNLAPQLCAYIQSPADCEGREKRGGGREAHLKHWEFLQEAREKGDQVCRNLINVCGERFIGFAVAVSCTHWVVHKQNIGRLNLHMLGFTQSVVCKVSPGTCDHHVLLDILLE